MDTDVENNRPTGPKFSNKDDVFDLDNIPKKMLDKGWKRYRPNLYIIPHVHPLHDCVFYPLERLKSLLKKSFPISEKQCKILNDGDEKCLELLVSHTDDNLEVIEDILEDKGLYRVEPTEENLLVDSQNREWLHMRFKKLSLYDVSSQVFQKYKFLYHLAPYYRGHSILNGAIRVKNSNPSYDYFKTRAVYYGSTRTFFSEHELIPEDKQRLVDRLYDESCKRNWSPTPDYLLFTFDLNQIKNDTVRFGYNSHYSKGIVSYDNGISCKYILKTEKIAAHAGYNDTWGWGIWGNKNKKIKKLTKKEILHYKKKSHRVPEKTMVGKFFYDPEDNDLCGVTTLWVNKVKDLGKHMWPVKVIKSHQQIWNEGLKKQEDNPQEKPYFQGTYEESLRGYVTYIPYHGTFEIHVGDWIHQHPDCIEKVIQRFNLSGCTVHTFLDRRLCRT